MKFSSGLNSRHQLLVDSPSRSSTAISWFLAKWRFTKQSAYPFYRMDVRAGSRIHDTLRHWKPIISAACKVFLAFADGTGKHIEIRNSAKRESVEHLMLQRQLRWLSHVIRMPSNHLPRRLLYGELLLGQRPVGRPKLCYSDHMKSVLRQCNIPVSDLEQLAENTELWSLTCTLGLKNLTAASEQAASDRRARRHAATPAGRVCPHCGRTCASDFGLRSHLRIHYPLMTTVQSHRQNWRTTPSMQAISCRQLIVNVD